MIFLSRLAAILKLEKTPMTADKLKDLIADSWTRWSKNGIKRK